MNKILINTPQDLSNFVNLNKTPVRFKQEQIHEIRQPDSYPAVLVWDWQENAYDCKEWLSYTYVYPADFK